MPLSLLQTFSLAGLNYCKCSFSGLSAMFQLQTIVAIMVVVTSPEEAWYSIATVTATGIFVIKTFLM